MTNARLHTLTLSGALLAHLRKQKGWSGEDLGQKLNVSKQAISRWENDQVPPAQVSRVLALMGISADEWEQMAMAYNEPGAAFDHGFSPPHWHNMFSSDLKTFIVPDETMNPWASQGEIVLYDETTPPRRGDGCIIKTKQGETYLRLYQSRDSVNWHFHSLNPDATTTMRYDFIDTVSKIVLRGG